MFGSVSQPRPSTVRWLRSRDTSETRSEDRREDSEEGRRAAVLAPSAGAAHSADIQPIKFKTATQAA